MVTTTTTERGTTVSKAYALNPETTAAVAVSDLGVVTVEQARAIDGGVNAVYLTRTEATELFVALGAILGRQSVGNCVPVEVQA
jgi:hypothetical protein